MKPEKPLKPRLLPSGWLICPACHNLCESPTAKNPHTGIVEKLILKPGTCRCPHCPAVHEMSEVERWHNAVWYVDDPVYAPGPLYDESDPPPRIRIWTWRKATAAIPYLAPLVGNLRSATCRVAHLRLAARRVGSTRTLVADLADAAEEVVRLAEEIEAAGVLTHGGPLRGVVLFPSFVHHAGSKPKPLYLVWRDSRDAIETYAMAEDMRPSFSLEGCEKPLPKAWREVGP